MGLATDSGLEFQRHIPQHQKDSSTAQCLLCGLCHTSAGLLSRHLFIVHKVRDQEEEEAEAAEPEEGSGEEVPMETRENGLKKVPRSPRWATPRRGDHWAWPRMRTGPKTLPVDSQTSQDRDSHTPSPHV